MSAKKETAIWLAIKSRIDTLSMTIDKAWPGEAYNPTNKPYLRIGRVSAAPQRELIANGKPHIRTGSIIITLVYPLGQNISVYDQLAATVAEHFEEGTEMSYRGVCVTVTDYPNVQEGYEDNGWWTVPVVIPWRCFI